MDLIEGGEDSTEDWNAAREVHGGEGLLPVPIKHDVNENGKRALEPSSSTAAPSAVPTPATTTTTGTVISWTPAPPQDRSEVLKRAKLFFESKKGAAAIDHFDKSFAPPITSKKVIDYKNKVRVRVLGFTPRKSGDPKSPPARVEGQVIEWQAGEYIGHSPGKQETELYDKVLQTQVHVREPLPITHFSSFIEVSSFKTQGKIVVGGEVIIENVTYSLNWMDKDYEVEKKVDGKMTKDIVKVTYEPRFQFNTGVAIIPAGGEVTFNNKVSLAQVNAVIIHADQLTHSTQNKQSMPELPVEFTYEHPVSKRMAPNPAYITNEWILSRAQSSGFLVLRVDNSLETHAAYGEDMIAAQYENFNGWFAQLKMPEMEGLSQKDKKEKIETFLPCLNGTTTVEKSPKFQELPAIVSPLFLGDMKADGEPFGNGQVFLTAKTKSITALGIAHTKIWQACAHQLMTGLKALAFLQVDSEKSRACYERDVISSGDFSFSYAGTASFVYDYKNMFDVCGLKVSAKMLSNHIDALLKEESEVVEEDAIFKIDAKLEIEPDAKCQCLNTLPLQQYQNHLNKNKFTRLFYLVPSIGMMKNMNLAYSPPEKLQKLVDTLQFYKFNKAGNLDASEAHWMKLFNNARFENFVVFSLAASA